MSIIDSYAKQTATWQRRTGYDGHGDPVYSSSVIACRWEWTQRLIRNAEGQEIASQGKLFTTAAVKPDDRMIALDGQSYVILAVSVQYGLNGAESHREAYV